MQQQPAPARSLLPLLDCLPWLRPYSWRIALVGVALIVSSLATLSIGPGVGWLIDAGLFEGDIDRVYYAVGGVLILSLVLATSTWVRYYNVSWLGERVSADLRNRVFGHLIHLHPDFFDGTRGGDLQSRFTTDTALLQSVIGSSVSIALRNAVIIVGGIVLMFILNYRLAFGSLLCVPLVVAPVLLLGRRVKALSNRTQTHVGEVSSELGEVVRHIKTVQAFNRQDLHVGRFEHVVGASFEAAVRMIRQRSWMIAFVIFLCMSSLALLVFLGRQEVLADRATAGSLISFIFVVFMVAGSTAMVAEVFSELLRAAGALERLLALLDQENELDLPRQEASSSVSAGEGRLEIRTVKFSYPRRPEISVLDGFSLTARRGQWSALIGLSGSGKSTLFDLLLRMYDWQEGEIWLDGEDIREMDVRRLRGRIGLVRQENPILDGTVWENIAYGNDKATDADIQSAARKAQADEFICRLPKGFQTLVGEGGSLLSAGQRQRIAIARTLLAKPEVLLLDEITSHLDAHSEMMVQNSIEEIAGSCTVLVVAHRLSTVRRAQQIHFMQRGRVAASGTHEALMAANEEYRLLVRTQLEPFAEEPQVQVQR